MTAMYASDLHLCRQERATELGRAFLALVRQRAQAARDGLVRAEGPQVARLQGAVLCLEALLHDLESDPQSPDRQDGGYA